MKSYVIIAGRAWELIRLAKDKYAKSGNMVGVGRCENNMGNFCIHEKQRQEAIQHFKNALEIKEDLNDVPGVLNQLAMVIGLYQDEPDIKYAETFVTCALMYLSEHNDAKEKYNLYHSLALYYIMTEDYARGLQYEKLAREGIEYLSSVNPKVVKEMDSILHLLESMFSCKEESPAVSNTFEENLREATRLSKANEMSACLELLGQLERKSCTD